MSGDRSYSLILIVDQDPATLAAMIAATRRTGHQTTGVATFEEARRQMRLDLPDVLITQAHLSAFNGLHLVLLGRATRTDFQAIVIGDTPDPVLEREVVRAGAVFLVKPVPTEALLTIISVLMGGPAPDDAPPRIDIEPRPDRRVAVRRHLMIPGFTPERRVADRRRFPGA